MGRHAGEGTSEEACEDTDVRAAGAHGQAQPTSFWYLRMLSSAAAHCANRKSKHRFCATGASAKLKRYKRFHSGRMQCATHASHDPTLGRLRRGH
jgi:hypothetical protein